MIRIVILLLSMATAASATTAAPPLESQPPLVLGVFPRRPAVQTEAMFKPLAAELASQLGRTVVLEVPGDFAAFWHAIEAGRYQLVHYNPYHYLHAHRDYGHRLVAMNEEFGSNRIRSAIWVRKNGRVHKASDLRHSRIAFGGGRDAMVSYIMATDLLQQAGLISDDYIPQFTINPTRAVMALFYGQSKAAGLNENAFKQPRLSAAIDGTQLEPLLVSEPVAQHPWAVSARVDEALRLRIRDALLGMKDSEAGRAALARAELTGLVPATDADYDAHRRIVERVLGEHY